MATTTQPATGEQANKRPRDFRQEVTDNIVRMLENGAAPWQKPWEPAAATGIPMNPTSGRAYRGGNALHLMATALMKGYQDPRWMTYKQASEHGWQVRRGEKGTQIEFWDVREKKEADAAKGENADRPHLIHRVYTVFNAAQIDGIPNEAPQRHSVFEAVQSGERILAASGAEIEHDQANSAFYNRAIDSIHLPPKDVFKDAMGYYGTALHELAHWTGHPSRLNRSTLNESYRFGDVNYAKEELRAELASVFLAAERGVPHDPAQHAAYVGSWIRSLKEDKNEIFRAAHDASVATDFLLSLELERSRAEEELASAQEASVDSGRWVSELQDETAEVHRDRERLEELAVATRELGDSAKVHPARTEGGRYRGQIIGETATHVVQRESAQSAVTHPKEVLDRTPTVGEVVRISYSNSKGTVREAPERERTHGLAR